MNILSFLVKSAYAQGAVGGRPGGGSDDIIGTVTLPEGIPQEVGGTTDFISGLIRFIIIVAGIFALWQFLSGGLGIITAGGDKGKLSEAQQKIQMSLLGLVVIAGSFIVIAIMSQLLFGSFTAILAPKLTPIGK